MGEDTETEVDMRTRLVVQYKAQAEDNVSSLSLGDQSYILDLSNQRHFRAECRREEAMEDALELYQAAIEEGAPEGVELFQLFMAQMLKELNEENREKDRLQDQWLEAALQEELDRQQQQQQQLRAKGLNVSNHSQLSKSNHSRRSERSKSFSGPPSIFNGRRPTISMRRQSSIRMLELDIKIHDEEKNILHKKINKAERLIKELIDEKGIIAAKATIKYKNLHKKIKEYKATLHKAEQDDLKISKHSKARSVMYDWGAVDDDDKTENEDDDDASSLSSSSNKSDDKNSSRFNDEEFEWAKQVVAKLNLDGEDNEIVVPNMNNADTTMDVDKLKRTPNKNISFSTINATTRRMSGHEMRTKTLPGTPRVSETLFVKQPLAVTQEEEEADETGTTQVSVGSESTPAQHAHPLPQSPGKRKTPSWKDAETVKFSPVKQLVSHFQEIEKVKRKSIGYPPLTNNTSPEKRTVETKSVGYPPLTNNTSPEKRTVETKSVGYPPLSNKTSPEKRTVETKSVGYPPFTNNTSAERKPVETQSVGYPPLANLSPAEEKPAESIVHVDSPTRDKDTKSNIGKEYTMEDFKQGKVSNIDMSDWEQFLSNSEFEKHFGMTRSAFGKLPKWKQSNAKRLLRTW